MGNLGDEDPGPSPYSDNYLAVFAATTIQKWFRGYRVRKAYKDRRSRMRRVELDWAAATDVGYRTDRAARAIQTAWRAYRNRRIYRYYRDLIRFRERGDPRELLRVINPREAALVDAAAGIHVRFRLGGSTFPPLVFYKIFTHRPVADIGAFGPRDYANEVRMTAAELHNRPAAAALGAGIAAAAALGGTGGSSSATGGPAAAGVARLRAGGGGGGSGAGSAASSAPGSQRQSPDRLRGTGGGAGPGRAGAAGGGGAGGKAKKKHTYREDNFELDSSYREYIKPDGTVGVRSTQGWYERHENNGWRPVAERVLLDEDPTTTATRLKRQPLFHFNPAVRREERARKIKQRKREWLRRVYLEGGTAAAGAAGGTAGRDGTALGALYGKLDSELAGLDLDELDDEQLDGKADELLAWSQHLDFGSYFDDWTSTACTLASEAFVPEDEAPYLDEIREGTRGDVRAAMAVAGAPMPPFKGGATAASGSTVVLRS